MTRRTVLGSRSSTSERDAEGLLSLQAAIAGYPGWWVTARVDDSLDPPAIVELTIRRQPNPVPAAVEAMGGKVKHAGPAAEVVPAVTADLLRSIRFGPLVDQVNQHLARHREVPPNGDPRDFPAGSDEYLAAFAARYTHRIAVGSKRPNADLADELGMRPSQIRDLVFACRKKGFLTAAAAGRSTGVLTEKAAEILRAMEPTKPSTKKRATK